MYTVENLIEIVTNEGEKVSPRQIREWNGDGLLPTPTREKIPGQGKGRAPYRFPEPTPAAVVTLAKERRYMKSAEDAKLWLWLEGFDHTGVDPDERLQNWLVNGWEEKIRAKVPSALKLSDTEQIDYERGEQIRDELDRNVISPNSTGDQGPDEYTAYSMMLSAMLGLSSLQETSVPVDKALMNSSPYTVRRALLASVRHLLPEMSSEEASAFSIPDAMGERVPRQQIREIWDALCIVTEILDEPTEGLPFIHAAVGGMLHKLRYALYRDNPEYVIYGLSCAVRFLARKHPNQLRETLDTIGKVRESVKSS